MKTREPMERFLKYIGSSFMYSDDLHFNYQYGDRESETLKKAHFIHLPKTKFQYIGIDLDWEGSASLWMDEGLPEPTITIVTSKSAHSKYFYELSTPVTLPLNQEVENINLKPYKYYKHVKLSLDVSLGGDLAYSGGTINNPFLSEEVKINSIKFDGVHQNMWKVHWSDNTYDLHYLSEFGRSVPRDYKKEINCDISNRESSMFHMTRLDAYRLVNDCQSFEEFSAKVLSSALCHWNELRLIPKDHELAETEAHSVARSVSKWVWIRRNDRWLKKFSWDLGKLQFAPIDYQSLSEDDVESEITNRQKIAASYTHEKRRSETEKKIRDACAKLITDGAKLTRKSIFRESGVGESTLGNYRTIINEYK